MSSSIWTRSAASSKIRPLAAHPWRVVEAQHRISTRQLVDSDHEQQLLEELLETAKPPAGEAGRLHYLLTTPFRYPPLPHGSRFGSRWEPGIWYGSEDLRTAFAEVAYYRLLFLAGTDADLGTLEADLSAFHVPITTTRGLDLAAEAFARWRPAIESKTSYEASQAIGTSMRAAGIEAFRYRSARDVQHGASVGLFTSRAFAATRPRGLETWHSVAAPASVEFSKRDYFERKTFRFAREQFLVDGQLPWVGKSVSQ